MIRFTPRNPKSVWSQRNIDLVKRLTAEGRMRQEGLAAFAHKDVHTDSGYRTADLSAELAIEMAARFKAAPRAWAFYQAQPAGYRRKTARWVMSAKREETQQRRFSTLLEDSGNERRIKQFRKS